VVEARAGSDDKTGTATALRKKPKDPTEAVQLPIYAWLSEAAAAYLPINDTPVARLELDGETDVDTISRRLPELRGTRAVPQENVGSRIKNLPQPLARNNIVLTCLG
jgi:ATP-dependent helicase/nuclease subunit B